MIVVECNFIVDRSYDFLYSSLLPGCGSTNSAIQLPSSGRRPWLDAWVGLLPMGPMTKLDPIIMLFSNLDERATNQHRVFILVNGLTSNHL
jgi:hypothetical protein